MAIPDYQSIMLPFLKFIADNEEHSFRETVDGLANEFQLTEEEQKELLPSGQQEIFSNRVGWARTYMKKAGFVDSTRRSYVKITDKGLAVLKQNPQKIDVHFLDQFQAFKDFRASRHKKDDEENGDQEIIETTPEEALETAYQRLRDDLAIELLQQIKSSSPSQFEKIVVELLVKMGYGGSRHDAGKAIGKRGDEGIDGFIKEDRLGLDIIYIQAKRWNGTVGSPEVREFAGSLEGQHARKGIMITTSTFSHDAHDYVSRIHSKIVLIDGQRLAQLMIDNTLGVSQLATYEIKRIDSDYFTEE